MNFQEKIFRQIQRTNFHCLPQLTKKIIKINNDISFGGYDTNNFWSKWY